MIESLKDLKIEDVSRLILFGSDNKCSKNEECESGVCYYGICTGYLLSSNFYTRYIMKRRILEMISNIPSLRTQLTDDLSIIISNENHDPYLTGRALLLLATIGSASGQKELKKASQGSSEIIRFFAGMGLCSLRDSSAVQALEEFINHESPSVKLLATRCLKE